MTASLGQLAFDPDAATRAGAAQLIAKVHEALTEAGMSTEEVGVLVQEVLDQIAVNGNRAGSKPASASARFTFRTPGSP